MKKLLALVLALVLCASCAMAETITLNIWSFTNEFQGMIEKYYAPTHPDIEFNFVIYPTDGGEYTSKVDTLLATDAAGAEAPDVFTLEAAFVKKYVNSAVTADLLTVGFTADEFATCIPAMLQIGQDNATGAQKGLAWQSTPGALFYRADLAEKYLGITTPEDFQAAVADWDTFMETARTLNEASNGACKMFVATGDIWNAYQYSRESAWVVDGALVIDPVLEDYMDMLKEADEDDLYAKGSAWTETWYAGMRGDMEIMTFLLPTWGLHYTIKPHCVAGGDTMTEDQLAAAAAEGNGTYGLWRMVAGPVGYSWGGTWVGVNAEKAATADDAKKAAIHELVAYFTLSEEFLYAYGVDSGDFVSNNAVVEKITSEVDMSNPFLGGQDHYKMFAEAASLANGSLLTEYDEKINSLFDDECVQPYIKGEKDKDQAIADFKAAVMAQFPELVVE